MEAQTWSKRTVETIKSIEVEPWTKDVSNALPVNKKVALLIANSYEGTQSSLDEGPRNDALKCYSEFRKRGIRPFIYYDVTVSEFKSIFTSFLKAGFEHLYFYYSGHGASVADDNGDEADGKDECFCFPDRCGRLVGIRDDAVWMMIKTFNKAKRLTMLVDCCHSETIFDIPDKGFEDMNICTITAAADNEEAAQAWLGASRSKPQGAFTYYFWKEINEGKHETFTDVVAAIQDPVYKAYRHHIRVKGDVSKDSGMF